MARTKQNKGRSGLIAMNPVPRLRSRTYSNAESTVLEASTADSNDIPDATVIEVHADGHFNDDTIDTDPDNDDSTAAVGSNDKDPSVDDAPSRTSSTEVADVITVSSDESKMDTSNTTDDSAVSTADGSVCDSGPGDGEDANASSNPDTYESVSLISDLTRRATAATTNDASLVDVQVVSVLYNVLFSFLIDIFLGSRTFPSNSDDFGDKRCDGFYASRCRRNDFQPEKIHSVCWQSFHSSGGMYTLYFCFFSHDYNLFFLERHPNIYN